MTATMPDPLPAPPSPVGTDGADADAPDFPEKVAHPARPLALSPRVTAGAALRVAAEAGLRDLLDNVPAVGSVEGVHQMRVAIRRLRSLLVLFEPLLDGRTAAAFEEELRRLGRVLGEARDWDVFCGETLPAVFGADPTPLHEAAEAARAEARTRLTEELARPALSDMARALAAWAERGPGRGDDPTVDRPLRKIAPELLDRAERTVFKRGRHIEALGEEDLHRLRKAAKKLRYAVEGLAGLYGEKSVRRYGKQCRKLQELLGLLNDRTVALVLAEHLATGRPDLLPPLAVLRRWSEKGRKKAAKGVPRAWDRFRTAAAPWK